MTLTEKLIESNQEPQFLEYCKKNNIIMFDILSNQTTKRYQVYLCKCPYCPHTKNDYCPIIVDNYLEKITTIELKQHIYTIHENNYNNKQYRDNIAEMLKTKKLWEHTIEPKSKITGLHKLMYILN